MFKVNNKDTRMASLNIVDFDHISHLFIAFLMLTLSKQVNVCWEVAVNLYKSQRVNNLRLNTCLKLVIQTLSMDVVSLLLTYNSYLHTSKAKRYFRWQHWLARFIYHTSSGIRQKGKSQNGCFKKAKHAKISEKQTFLTPWYAQVYLLYQTCIFFNFCFLETPVLRFALLSCYRRLYKSVTDWPRTLFVAFHHHSCFHLLHHLFHWKMNTFKSNNKIDRLL